MRDNREKTEGDRISLTFRQFLTTLGVGALIVLIVLAILGVFPMERLEWIRGMP